MSLRPFFFAAIAGLAATLPAIADSGCEAHSGPNTNALVELYTSEGCSSCPPADKLLSRLAEALDPAAEVVPLALHVGYWDDLGWIDPYAQEGFAQRQDWLARVNGHRTVYTPEFFVAGNELQASRRSLRDAVHYLNTTPAAASIQVRSSLSANGVLTLDAVATTRTGSDPTALYLAIAENGLVSKVARGENRGATLAHDHVAREWIGPITLTAGTTRAQRVIPLPATWQRDRLEIIAFVQNDRSGSVLQALRARLCTGNEARS